MRSSNSSKRRGAGYFGAAALAFTAAAAPFLLPACDGDDPPEVAAVGEGCLINTDCSAPLVCAFRRCHTQCEESRDCAAGQRCIVADRPFRVCQLDDERACAYNSECSGEQVCAIDGQCRDQCAADRDCVPGQLCTTGTCAMEDELVDGGLRPSNTNQATGQPCAYTSECPTGLVCRDGLCNWECITSADCDAFGTCNDDRRCVYPDAGLVYCQPGAQKVCGCVKEDGTIGNGEQVCVDDGSKYGPCEGCL